MPWGQISLIPALESTVLVQEGSQFQLHPIIAGKLVIPSIARNLLELTRCSPRPILRGAFGMPAQNDGPPILPWGSTRVIRNDHPLSVDLFPDKGKVAANVAHIPL